MRTKHYSDFLTSVCALIGVQSSDLTAGGPELGILNAFFNKAMKYIWQQTNWVDVCPFGEARLAGNLIAYANNYTNTLGAWTPFQFTVTDNYAANPADGRATAGFLNEQAVNAEHYLYEAQNEAVIANTAYLFSVFVKPVGRQYCKLQLLENSTTGTLTRTCFFSLNGSGAVLVAANCTGAVSLVGNGYYQVSIRFTSGTTAFSAQTFLFGSSVGTNTVYVGTAGYGLYIWGWWLGPGTNAPLNQLIPWEQTGEEAIDVVFDAWNSPPLAPANPGRIGYTFTPDGLEIINSGYGWNYPYYAQTPQGLLPSTSTSPLALVYLSYRKRVPDYSGAAYSAAATYAVGAQVYFTNSAGYSDYWQTAGGASAGQSPDSNPDRWKLLSIPYVFFDYAVADSMANWLRTEGQYGRAQAMDAYAQDLLDREADRQERTLGLLEPMKVRTHLTSRPNPSR